GGLGWRSVFAVAVGAQYQATDRLTLRAGYLYNTNPIPNPVTLFNVQAPGIITNTLSLGASYQLTDGILFSAAWVPGFRDSIQGPILQLPGSSVRLDAQADTLWAGFTVKFGGSRGKGPGGTGNSGAGNGRPPATWNGPYDSPPPVPSDPASTIP